MRVFPWQSREDQTLSAYLDGELDEGAMAACGERLVFDGAFRRKANLLRRVTDLARVALAPPRIADSAALADRVLAAMGRSRPDRAAAPTTPPRRLLRPAILASVGIAVTVGLTLVGLRRRGLV